MDFVINTILWTFAFYGFFEIVKEILYLFTLTKFKSDGIYLIIGVKNQEENIEMFLRSTMFKVLYGKEEHLKNIIVTDLDSKDKTREILQKMSKEYECINVVNWKECKEIIDNVDCN